MIYFTDENISEYAARMLGYFDRRHEVRPHIDHFKKGTADIEWMPTVAQWRPKPILVCGDGRILRNEAEKRILRECRMMYVYLSSGWTNLPWVDFAWKIVKAWPDIVRAVERAGEPTIFEVKVTSLKIKRLGLVSQL